MRNISRNPPRQMILRVARRDNYLCQICGKPVLDKEIEFDHKIPWSRGGPTEESNIRLTCEKCNNKKRAKVPEDL
ncbi:MAG: HNH endonuclease [Candidatus Micrarchaeota archaeon]|nr:HNH endonuclease [Candidatus Micrarchaeota archaeon]